MLQEAISTLIQRLNFVPYFLPDEYAPTSLTEDDYILVENDNQSKGVGLIPFLWNIGMDYPFHDYSRFYMVSDPLEVARELDSDGSAIITYGCDKKIVYAIADIFHAYYDVIIKLHLGGDPSLSIMVVGTPPIPITHPVEELELAPHQGFEEYKEGFDERKCNYDEDEQVEDEPLAEEPVIILSASPKIEKVKKKRIRNNPPPTKYFPRNQPKPVCLFIHPSRQTLCDKTVNRQGEIYCARHRRLLKSEKEAEDSKQDHE